MAGASLVGRRVKAAGRARHRRAFPGPSRRRGRSVLRRPGGRKSDPVVGKVANCRWPAHGRGVPVARSPLAGGALATRDEAHGHLLYEAAPSPAAPAGTPTPATGGECEPNRGAASKARTYCAAKWLCGLARSPAAPTSQKPPSRTGAAASCGRFRQQVGRSRNVPPCRGRPPEPGRDFDRAAPPPEPPGSPPSRRVQGRPELPRRGPRRGPVGIERA